MTAQVLQLAEYQPRCLESADALRKLADLADAGEIVSITVVYVKTDGTSDEYQSSTINKHQVAGALLAAAMRRVG